MINKQRKVGLYILAWSIPLLIVSSFLPTIYPGLFSTIFLLIGGCLYVFGQDTWKGRSSIWSFVKNESADVIILFALLTLGFSVAFSNPYGNIFTGISIVLFVIAFSILRITSKKTFASIETSLKRTSIEGEKD